LRILIVTFLCVSALGAASISPALNEALAGREITDFVPVWAFLDQEPTAADVFRFELLGTRVRTRSRWLKGVSLQAPAFAIPDLNRIEGVRALDLVRSGRYQDAQEFRLPTDTRILGGMEFDYGFGSDQITTLNVDQVHAQGFFGSDVTLAVFDTGFDSTHPSVSHLWERNAIKAAHDFNSGDRIVTPLGQPILPFQNVRYVNSLCVARNSEKSAIVFSVASEESLAGSAVRPFNKWALYYAGDTTGSGYFETFRIAPGDSFASQPSALIIGDTLLVVWQVIETGAGSDVLFAKLALGDSLAGTSNLSLDSQSSVDPTIVGSGDTLWVLWADERGVFGVRSTDFGASFEGEVTVLYREGEPMGLHTTMTDGTILAAVSLSDTLHFMRSTDWGASWESQVLGSGALPHFVAVDSDVYLIASSGNDLVFHRSDDLGATWSSVGTVVSETYPTSAKLMHDGSTLRLVHSSSEGYLLRASLTPGGSVGSPDTLDGLYSSNPEVSGDFLAWRRRGDDDVSIWQDGYVENTMSFRYHGTKILSVIAGFQEGNLIGPALGSDIVLAKTEKTRTSAGRGFENQVEEDFWAEALEWATERGAQVVSSSLGYGPEFPWAGWYSRDMFDGETAVSSRAASMAAERGVLVATAMGNVDHTSIPDPSIGDTTLLAPADAMDILAVGGHLVNQAGDLIAHNTSYGPSSDGRLKPEVISPYWAYAAADTVLGGEAEPTKYLLFAGTSYSTALAAGVSAMIWEAHPSWTAYDVRDAILSTADPVPIANLPEAAFPNYIEGYGLIDAYAALNHDPLEVQTAEGDAILTPFPNPFNTTLHGEIVFPLILFHASYVTLKVFTLSGELVWTYQSERLYPGRGEGYDIRWDGRNDAGNRVAPGVYIAVLKTGFGSHTKKFAVVE
jgi:subtilisin family serine protease